MLGIEILELLGVSYKPLSSGWLHIPCLLAKHKHTYGVDRNPSARINPTGYGYLCEACGSKYHSPTVLLWDLFNLNNALSISNDRVNQALSLCECAEPAEHPLHSMNTETEHKVSRPVFRAFPKAYLAKYPPVLSRGASGSYRFFDAFQFLAGRSIPKQVIEDFDMRWDDKHKRVLIPTYSKGRTLAGFEGRFIYYNPAIIGENTPPKYYVYTHAEGRFSPRYSNNGLVWFRQSHLRPSRPLVVVEGMFDAARIYQHYRNVTCMSGSHVSPDSEKFNYLRGCKQVILIPDNDLAGQHAAEKLKMMLHRMQVIQLPDAYKDAGAMPALEVRTLLSPHLKLDPPIWTKAEAASLQAQTSFVDSN